MRKYGERVATLTMVERVGSRVISNQEPRAVFLTQPFVTRRSLCMICAPGQELDVLLHTTTARFRCCTGEMSCLDEPCVNTDGCPYMCKQRPIRGSCCGVEPEPWQAKPIPVFEHVTRAARQVLFQQPWSQSPALHMPCDGMSTHSRCTQQGLGSRVSLVVTED